MGFLTAAAQSENHQTFFGAIGVFEDDETAVVLVVDDDIIKRERAADDFRETGRSAALAERFELRLDLGLKVEAEAGPARRDYGLGAFGSR